MKIKFKVEINSNGSDLTSIITMIANHNEGIANINNDVIASYILAKNAQYPSFKIKLKNDGDTLHVSEDDGKTWYLSIQECEVLELNEEPQKELIEETDNLMN